MFKSFIFLMLDYILLLLLLSSNAVTSKRDKFILYARVVITILTFCSVIIILFWDFNFNPFLSITIVSNLWTLSIIWPNYICDKRKITMWDMFYSFVSNFKFGLKYIKKNLFTLLRLIIELLIIGLVIRLIYDELTNFSYNDSFLLHLNKCLFLFFIISIISSYRINSLFIKKKVNFSDALKCITLTRFVFFLCFYTVWVYLGLAQYILVCILPFVYEVLIYVLENLFSGIKGLAQFNPLGIKSFAKIFMHYPLANKRGHFIINNYKASYMNTSNGIIKFNFIFKIDRNYLFGKPNFIKPLKIFNNISLLNLLKEKKLYISNCMISKYNYNNVKISVYISNREIYANFCSKTQSVFVSSNKNFITSINNLDKYSKSFELSMKDLTKFNKDFKYSNPDFSYLNGSAYTYQIIRVNMQHSASFSNFPENEQSFNESASELIQNPGSLLTQFPDYGDNIQYLPIGHSNYAQNPQIFGVESLNTNYLVQTPNIDLTELSILDTQNLNNFDSLVGQSEQIDSVSDLNTTGLDINENTMINVNYCDPTSDPEITDWTIECENALRWKEARIIGNLEQIYLKLYQLVDGIPITRIIPEKVHFDYLRFLMMAKDAQIRRQLSTMRSSIHPILRNSPELREVINRITNSKWSRVLILRNQQLNYNFDNLDYKKKRWLEASLLSLCRYPLQDHWRNHIANPIARDIVENNLDSLRVFDLQNNMHVRLSINRAINRLHTQIFPND